MKILVLISKVPDTTTKIQFKDGDTQFDESNVQWIINPTDEWYALVRGIEVKEATGGTVTVINVGEAENDAIIRKALAIGADDAIRINANPTDAYFVANQIAAVAKEGGYDLVFTGKESISYNGGQIGSMLSEMLDIPYVSLATKMTLDGNTATIEREVEGGVEVVQCALPMLVSASKGLAEQRIPNMRGIMGARSKPLTVVEPTDNTKATEIVSYELPEGRVACKMINADNIRELVDLLHNEAKVI